MIFTYDLGPSKSRCSQQYIYFFFFLDKIGKTHFQLHRYGTSTLPICGRNKEQKVILKNLFRKNFNFFGHVYEIQLPDNACIVGYTLEKSLGCVCNVLLNRVWFSGSWVLNRVFDSTISHLQEDVFLVSVGTVWSDAALNWGLKGQLRGTGCHQQAVSFWSIGRWFKRYIYLAITHVK